MSRDEIINEFVKFGWDVHFWDKNATIIMSCHDARGAWDYHDDLDPIVIILPKNENAPDYPVYKNAAIKMLEAIRSID